MVIYSSTYICAHFFLSVPFWLWLVFRFLNNPPSQTGINLNYIQIYQSNLDIFKVTTFPENIYVFLGGKVTMSARYKRFVKHLELLRPPFYLSVFSLQDALCGNGLPRQGFDFGSRRLGQLLALTPRLARILLLDVAAYCGAAVFN